MLKPHSDKDGYAIVVINYKGHKDVKVHRLVAKAFIKDGPVGEQVNHKNGIKDDNNVGNLEWCTARENILHKFRILKRDYTGKAGRKGIVIVDEDGKEYQSQSEIIRQLGRGTQPGLSYALKHGGEYYGKCFKYKK